MLKDERQTKIIQLVNAKSYVNNTYLAEITNSTIQTIINDIKELNSQGKLIKVYGGAKSRVNKPTSRFTEAYEQEKDYLNIDLKNKIACEATDLINDGDLIFLDTGTTVKQMIKYLVNKKITVVTNGYSIALELMEQAIEVWIVGGKILPSTHATVGELSLKFIDNFCFDKAFIGMNNWSDNHFYTTNIPESLIKEKVLNQTKEAYILMDSSKFYKKNKVKVNMTKQACLISNEEPNNYKGNIIIA